MPPQPLPSLLKTYQQRFAAGDLKPDPAQAAAVDVLQVFAEALNASATASPSKNGSLHKLWRSFSGSGAHNPPSGLYIYGKVGRGKSMLMDMFMEHVAVEKKRRVHFHQFMLEIHARLYRLRQNKDNGNIMASLAASIAAETTLLCFDEFHVGNIADAMILGRLFSGLFDAGVTIVATSNWAPEDLYKNGLQRDRFLPFIELIKRKMSILPMGGDVDYRFEQLRHLQSYFQPLNLDTTRKLQGIFIELTHDTPPVPLTLPVEGRALNISRAAHGIGFFNFDELCCANLGAADYLAIAECLHTVILDGVPVLRAEQRNEAVRLITLIDALYEAKVKIFMATAAPIDRLFLAIDEAVPFERTISRLMEMQGETYRLKPHLG